MGARPVAENKYNDRLFSGGIRKWFHMARFRWLGRTCSKYAPNPDCVVELGCFDGRAVGYLPGDFCKYYGFDANWDGGLEKAKSDFAGRENLNFQECRSPEEMKIDSNQKASVIISLETLEHIPTEMLEGYLRKLKDTSGGYFFVTVPNEMGMVFLAKHLLKIFVYRDARSYAFNEAVYSVFGMTDKVRRKEHKGFNWRKLHRQISDYFEPIEVSGVQFPLLPTWLNMQIGLVYRAR